MNNTKKRLLENFISLGALQIFSYVIPLITLPYLSRVLGVEKFGLVFFAQAFVEYFRVLTEYGFHLSATREIAVNRHNQNNISNIFNSVTVVKFLLLVISFVILLLAVAFIPKIHDEWLVFMLSFLMVVGNAIYPVWFFQGMEHMKYITFLNILAKTLFLVLIFIFVKSRSDYILVPLLNALGFIVSGAIGFVFAVKKFKIKLYIPKWHSIKKQFLYSTEFFLSRASVTAFTCTNTFFLGLITSNSQVAYYVAAEKIYTALKNLASPVINAMYPFVAKYKDLATYKKIYIAVLILNALLCTLIFIFAKEVITIFYGSALTPAYFILRIFCPCIFIVWSSAMMGYPLLAALGYTKEVNYSVIFASFVHIAGLIILYLLNMLTVYSIAYLSLVTELVILFLYLYNIFKHKIFTFRKDVQCH